MKFNKTDIIHEEMYNRMISENGVIHIGIYPVAFGFRVRAGYMDNDTGVEIDYCGGADPKQVSWLYYAVKTILEKREENSDVFAELPSCSKIKPFFNDFDFLEFITKQVGPFEVEEIIDLNEIRSKRMQNLW